MKKEEQLARDITEMIKLTKQGKIKWKVNGQTTEYNSPDAKPVIEEEGKEWIVDECYISYECNYKNKDFLMITYEMIHTCGELKKTTNLVFLPPLGIRYFDLHVLLPYSIQVDQILAYNIHQLWLMLLELAKDESDLVELDVSGRELIIE